MGFSRHEYWSWLPFPSPGELLDPGIKKMLTLVSLIKKKFFIGVWLIYNVVLVSDVQKSDSIIYIYIYVYFKYTYTFLYVYFFGATSCTTREVLISLLFGC